MLLNSAGYSRAELPMDDSVSIIAPNNTGKTSLINALQFLLIIDKRNMDFGAHSFENSRRFYFPDNSAYILLEVLLPSGMAVIGCVGKGLSHDYEYFSYQGSLEVDDFRLQNGSLVSQPKLIGHLIEQGKIARIFQQADLRSLLYGNRQKQRSDVPDLTIFPLEYISLAATYQRILTRTLRLDRLDTREVKNYLLEIFKNDLNDRSVDFKSEWDKSFADVNHDKAQYDAILRNKSLIESMQSSQQQRKALRGSVIKWRPLIEQGLNQWELYHKKRLDELNYNQRQLTEQHQALQHRLKTIYKEQAKNEAALESQNKLQQQCQELTIRFELVSDLEQLENQRKYLQEKRDELVHLIKSVEKKRSPTAIKRETGKVEKEISALKQQLVNLDNNFYLYLQQQLSRSDFEFMNRLLSESVLSLSTSTSSIIGQIELTDETAFKAFSLQISQYLSGSKLALPGLKMDLSSLEPNLEIKTAQELNDEIASGERQFEELTQLLETAESLEDKIQQRDQIEQKFSELDIDIKDYQTLLELQKNTSSRQNEIKAFQHSLEQIRIEETELGENKKRLDQKVKENEQSQLTLNIQHKRIDIARNQRHDHQENFSYLEQLPNLPCLEQAILDMTILADQIESYNRDCLTLIEINTKLERELNDLHRDGVSKYQYEDNVEKELEALFAFIPQLSQEKELIAGKARSAVIQVAAILRDLRSSLETFKRRMHEFNIKINRCQLSDLKVFKIEPREEELLVKAIQTLISTSEQVESGDSFDLFDHNAVLDDKALNNAKDLLIREGEARGSIRVEHLFHLVFKIAKENQPVSEFEDIDSAASNGTVLMAKLITGLAMLNQMQDPRKSIKTACYLDEAASLDKKNQRNLIEIATEFGFSLIFASPEPQITARYCVPIGTHNGKNHISRLNWQVLESITEEK